MTAVKNIDEDEKSCNILTNCAKDLCSVKTVKNRVPILNWLPKYSFVLFIQDTIAGITVGLTAIPQGIAYAIIADLPPAYGLYASLTAGIIYAVFGTLSHITIGPTSILATLTGQFVMGSTDMAVLFAFLSGIVQITLGIFKLGFLLDFISGPVLTGFTTGAALQIAASQLKSFFGMSGGSGHNFAQFVVSFFVDIKTITLWNTILGVVTIIMLVLLKKLGTGCSRTDGWVKQMKWFISLARNAVVVIIGIVIAYILKISTNSEPVNLIGEITRGLPKIRPPPFTTVIENETYAFTDMLKALGPQSIVVPLVAIMENIAIGKAFAEGAPVDTTQEIFAVGMCNLLGSFASSIPITGSFARAAINHASGVQTPFGGIMTAVLIFFTLSLLTSTFYYIPKATLAGLIIAAMYYMVNFNGITRLWKNSKREYLVFLLTTVMCLSFGLEYGILSGMIFEAAMLLFTAARPKIEVNIVRNDKTELLVIPLSELVTYCSADHIRRKIMEVVHNSDSDSVVVLDGTCTKRMDITVADNLISSTKDLKKISRKIVFVNFNSDLHKLCADIDPNVGDHFVNVSNYIEFANSIQKEV